jgi:hypothetical protein
MTAQVIDHPLRDRPRATSPRQRQRVRLPKVTAIETDEWLDIETLVLRAMTAAQEAYGRLMDARNRERPST